MCIRAAHQKSDRLRQLDLNEAIIFQPASENSLMWGFYYSFLLVHIVSNAYAPNMKCTSCDEETYDNGLICFDCQSRQECEAEEVLDAKRPKTHCYIDRTGFVPISVNKFHQGLANILHNWDEIEYRWDRQCTGNVTSKIVEFGIDDNYSAKLVITPFKYEGFVPSNGCEYADYWYGFIILPDSVKNN